MVTGAENISAVFKEHFLFTLITPFAKHNRKKMSDLWWPEEKPPEFECQITVPCLHPIGGGNYN
jgi:hypothetical protein